MGYSKADLKKFLRSKKVKAVKKYIRGIRPVSDQDLLKIGGLA